MTYDYERMKASEVRVSQNQDEKPWRVTSDPKSPDENNKVRFEVWLGPSYFYVPVPLSTSAARQIAAYLVEMADHAEGK